VTATIARRTVGRKSDKAKRDDVAVKMDRTLVDKAKFVASRKRITLAEYLTELNRVAIERDFGKANKEIEGLGGDNN
jgi:hypothetical protein